MKGSAVLAEQFAVNLGDAPRELVKVEALPDPPPTVSQTAQGEIPLSEDAIVQVLREEMDDLAVRLERFGIKFHVRLQQDAMDYILTVISLSAQGQAYGGGAIARR